MVSLRGDAGQWGAGDDDDDDDEQEGEDYPEEDSSDGDDESDGDPSQTSQQGSSATWRKSKAKKEDHVDHVARGKHDCR